MTARHARDSGKMVMINVATATAFDAAAAMSRVKTGIADGPNVASARNARTVESSIASKSSARLRKPVWPTCGMPRNLL